MIIYSFDHGKGSALIVLFKAYCKTYTTNLKKT